ncbi:hypothetical protein [Chryseobacterium gregarium]|nr:hypothetical protein [Chryseobacterium gregarium]
MIESSPEKDRNANVTVAVQLKLSNDITLLYPCLAKVNHHITGY